MLNTKKALLFLIRHCKKDSELTTSLFPLSLMELALAKTGSNWSKRFNKFNCKYLKYSRILEFDENNYNSILEAFFKCNKINTAL